MTKQQPTRAPESNDTARPAPDPKRTPADANAPTEETLRIEALEERIAPSSGFGGGRHH